MTVQEAIKLGYTEPQHLVYVWDLARLEDLDLEGRRAWLVRWGGLTGTEIPAWMLAEKALARPKEVG